MENKYLFFLKKKLNKNNCLNSFKYESNSNEKININNCSDLKIEAGFK